MKLHWFQHVPFEGLAAIEPWARDKGFEISVTRFWDGEKPPSVNSFDWLIVMGGPMNIYEDELYPWLREEKRVLKEALQTGKKVLGVCLGAQLLADALGAKVSKNRYKEIGWFPIRMTPQGRNSAFLKNLPEIFPAFHWHGDTFEIPQEGEPLFESAACRNQAFSYKNQALALQFHLESTPESLKELMENSLSELVSAPFIQTREVISGGEPQFEALHGALIQILENFYQLSRNSH